MLKNVLSLLSNDSLLICNAKPTVLFESNKSFDDECGIGGGNGILFVFGGVLLIITPSAVRGGELRGNGGGGGL